MKKIRNWWQNLEGTEKFCAVMAIASGIAVVGIILAVAFMPLP